MLRILRVSHFLVSTAPPSSSYDTIDFPLCTFLLHSSTSNLPITSANHLPGVYLTDLTFIEDGIPGVIKKTNLINFAKRAKTAEVIRDIQQYQNVPYTLQPVPELQDFILSHMQAAGDVHDMYDRSLQVEPREREDEKITRYVARTAGSAWGRGEFSAAM